MENNEEIIVENDFPKINRKGAIGKSFWVGLVLVILAFGGAIIYAVNMPKAHKSSAKNEDKSVSRLPPLIIPPKPPEPIVQQPQLIHQNTTPTQPANGKKKISWEDRKMMAGHLIGGSGKSDNENKEAFKPSSIVASKDNEEDELALSLKPTKTAAVSAAILPDRNYLITKGTSIDCVISDALDTTLPGLAVCGLTRDVYSASGNVILLERGTKLVGDVKSGIKQGQRRVGVLWTRAETPTGVVVNLDSASTDNLGRTGIAGDYNNHFWERFGAAIMISLLDTTSQVVGNNLVSGGGGTRNFFGGGGGGQGGTAVVKSVLQQDANIKPTIVVPQGANIRITVARDLDFSNVYKLKVKP